MIQASHAQLQAVTYAGLLHRDTPETHLASAAFLSHGGGFHNAFLASLTLKPEPVEVPKSTAGWSGPIVQLSLHQLSVVASFCA